MKLSLDWLRDYVALDATLNPQEIADALSNSGFEIESVVQTGADIDGVVIGRVLTCEKHPNADKLNLCTVDIGTDEPSQIVCGAPNVAAGQIVPVATVGTDLGGGFVIQKATLRGVESHGMICSEAELGLSDESDGILVLETDLPSGTPIADYFDRADTVMDLSITPNRPDCLSHTGIANELAVIYQTETKPLKLPVIETGNTDFISVDVDLDAGCERFTASLIRGVKIGASPEWLQSRLTAVGLRPINNLVDISNYVMYELGQPMHFYDYDQVQGQRLHIRSAGDETVTTLDSKRRTLTADAIVIEDGQGFAGLGGMMGGERTEVTEQTVNVLIEAAIWNSVRIQRAQRDLNLLTDASYRYSKGMDHNLVLTAQARAIQLILDICGGEWVGPVFDWEAKRVEPHSVSMRHERCHSLLGLDVEAAEIERIFTGLGFRKLDDESWEIPTHRQDITREVDLIEEVARIVGLNSIPSAPRQVIANTIDVNQADELIDRIKYWFSQHGFQEVMTNSMVRRDWHEPFSSKQPVEIMNPVSDEMGMMRSSLIPSLIKVADYNIKNQQADIAVFEVNKDYALKKKHAVETRKVAGVLTGRFTPLNWAERERPVDFFDVKGLVEAFIRDFRLIGATFKPCDKPYMSGISQTVELKSNAAAFFGKLDPSVQRKWKVSQPLYLFEINIDMLMANLPEGLPTIQDIQRFPTVERDIAVIVKRDIPAAKMVDEIEQAGGELLQKVEIFDIYRDEQFEADEHSIAFKLTFAADRTLTDGEVDPLFRGAIERLESVVKARLRDGQ